MILGPKKLLHLVKKERLVEDLADRELNQPEGAGFDLRINEIYEIDSQGKAFLGVTHRETPKVKLLKKYNSKRIQSFIFQPKKYYLVSTIEKVNLPLYLTANFKPRTTTFRSGLMLRTGNVAPGYHGKLTFALKNEGPIPVEIQLGARIIHIQFYEVDGGGNQYKGQWQGGRITTTKREKQI